MPKRRHLIGEYNDECNPQDYQSSIKDLSNFRNKVTRRVLQYIIAVRLLRVVNCQKLKIGAWSLRYLVVEACQQ